MPAEISLSEFRYAGKYPYPKKHPLPIMNGDYVSDVQALVAQYDNDWQSIVSLLDLAKGQHPDGKTPNGVMSGYFRVMIDYAKDQLSAQRDAIIKAREEAEAKRTRRIDLALKILTTVLEEGPAFGNGDNTGSVIKTFLGVIDNDRNGLGDFADDISALISAAQFGASELLELAVKAQDKLATDASDLVDATAPGSDVWRSHVEHMNKYSREAEVLEGLRQAYESSNGHSGYRSR